MAASPRRPEPIIPPQWAEAAAYIAGGGAAAAALPVILICGPKNSGKSTFSRYLLNALLPSYGRVGYLDTDVGQPEFSPPGCLALHVLHEYRDDLMNPCIKAPEMSYFFGDTSSKRDPEVYLNYAFSLYDYFLEEFNHFADHDRHGNEFLPLIINTPGWVKGTGFDLLVEMLRYIAPTHVVQIRISAESKNLPNGAFWLNGEQENPVDLISISSARQDMLNRSVLTQKDARGMRDHQLFEYFKQCFSSDLDITSNNELAHALASLPPYEVSISRVKIKHLHCQVPNSEIFHSLNATIVGLAVTSEGATTPCLGLGIVRGIDVAKGLLYMITPLLHGTLQKVDLLLQGLIEIPIGLLQLLCCLGMELVEVRKHQKNSRKFCMLLFNPFLRVHGRQCCKVGDGSNIDLGMEIFAGGNAVGLFRDRIDAHWMWDVQRPGQTCMA